MVHGEHQLDGHWTRLKGWVLACAVSLLRHTWRVHAHRPELIDEILDRGGAVIAFWHGEQLPLVPLHASPKIAGLASLSRDGALVAATLKTLGYRVIRGSSSRGGATAFAACRAALAGDLVPALAVDGPRGPRHHVHSGAVRLSRELGVPVVFMASHAPRALRLNSWDAFQIPLPWSRVEVAYGTVSTEELQAGSVEDGQACLRAKMLALSERVKRRSGDPSGG